MNDLQKSKITDLRSSGMSYAEIAENLGLSRDTVKSFCRRNNLAAETHKQQITNSDDLCRECGKHLTQTEGKKKRVFCCKECREKWWHSHPEQIHQRAVYEFVCPNCNSSFKAYGNRKRKYCSHECYISDRFGGGKND